MSNRGRPLLWLYNKTHWEVSGLDYTLHVLSKPLIGLTPCTSELSFLVVGSHLGITVKVLVVLGQLAVFCLG